MDNITTIVGVRSCDVVSYICRLINGSGKKVVVCDTSKDGELLSYLGVNNLEPKEVDVINKLYVCNGMLPATFKGKFDEIILYNGPVLTAKHIGYSSTVILITTPYKADLSKLVIEGTMQTLAELSNKLYLIAKDSHATRFDANYICSELKIKVKEENVYSILASHYDWYENLFNDGNPNFSFKRVSIDMKLALKSILALWVPKKEINSLYSRVSKGVQ